MTDFICSAAALVIQGSTSVYSKKVEYLHSLVYAALEAIAEKRCLQCSHAILIGTSGLLSIQLRQ